MKKIHCSFALVAALAACTQGASAQSVALSQNFEGSVFPPAGWLALDNDGDGRTWVACSSGDVTQIAGSSQLAVSFARNPKNYNEVYPDQDNWLITPAIEVSNNAYVLDFKYAAQDLDKTERLEVLVSEGGTAPDDFTSFYVDSYVDNGYEDDIVTQSFSRALTDYAGKTIRIAFRHQASGSYGLSVDNIYVYNQAGPLKPTGFTVKGDASGALKATLSWTNPSKTANGAALTDLGIVVYRDGVELTELTSGMTPGAAAAWTDENGLAGTHTYSIAARTSEGTGEALAAKSVYLGEDYPAAVKDLVAMATDGTVVLTWIAPTAGANKGQINLDNITYTVRRAVDGVVSTVATGVKETTWTDTEAPAGKVCVYTVCAVNGGGESPVEDSTAAVVFGDDVADLACFQTAERNNALTRLPIEINSKYSVSQSIYFPSDLSFVTGDIRQLVYKVFRGTDSSSEIPVRIYMHETTENAFTSSWLDTKDAKLVLDGTFTFSQGVRDVVFDLATPFEYKGGNLVVTFVKADNPMGSYSDRFYSASTGVANRSYTCSVYSEVDINNLPASNYPTITDQMPSTRFVVTPKGIGALSGTVTNGSTGAAVAGATVTAVGNDAVSAVTDENGLYSFRYFPVSIQQLKVTATGYEDCLTDVTVTDGAAVVKDVALVQQAYHTLTGKIVCGDTGLAAAGARVILSGYADGVAEADDKGVFTLAEVYSGRDYTLTVEYPLYDACPVEVNNEGTSVVTLSDLTLTRSLIAPFGVEAAVGEGAASVEISWPDPLSRDVEAGWKSVNDVTTQYSTSGDYSSTNYNVAHLFTADDIAAQKLAGTSVKAVKVYLEADKGEFAVRVWRDVAAGRVVVAEQKVPAELVSAAGGWVTVEFDEPAEIKAGSGYLFGVNCKNASSYPVGTAPSASYKRNYNNLKWAENPNEYCYDGYSAWCIIAECAVPGTDFAIVENDDVPAAAYNVYRRGAADGVWNKITPSPVDEFSFSDNAWGNLVSDVYTYAVTAVYANGESIKALAEPISRSNDLDAGVTAFVSPVKSVDVQNSVNVTVTVTNFGEKPVADIPVTLSVDGVETATATVAGPLAKGESANIDLGNLDIEKDVYAFTAETKLDGDMVAANNALTFTLPNLDNVELLGYRWDAYGYAGIMKVQTNVPEAADYMLELTPNDALVIAAERVNGKLHAYTATWYGASCEFVTIDPVTWTVEKAVENTDDYILDLTYDHVNGQMYGLRPDGYDVHLATVDLATGVATSVGNLGTTIRTLACDLKGKLYGISSDGDLYTINPATAEITLVGATGVGKASYLQSMGFDHKSGRLFWAHTAEHVNGDLYEVNPATGAATRLGGVLKDGNDQSEIVGLHSAYDPDMSGVTATATDGAAVFTVGADGRGNLIVNSAEGAVLTLFNAAGMQVGRLTAAAGNVTVPMNVVPGVYLVSAVSAGESLSLKVSVK